MMNPSDHKEEAEEDDGDKTPEPPPPKRARKNWSPTPDVPPAPPSTPAGIGRTLHPMSPSIFKATIQNASELERAQKLQESATPVPTPKPAATAAARQQQQQQQQQSTSIVGGDDDFSEWAVGDRYELIRMLGRGSYGEVAQAKDLLMTPNQMVAIKRITSAFDQEVDAIRLFREMHILRRLRGHDCIIQLLDVVQPPSPEDFHDLYLVFEYVDTDLYKLIMSPQYLTTEHIQTFLYQMLAGLKLIHSSSVIHRDLKPANILLNEDCSLKICDFGLARIVDLSAVSSVQQEETTNNKATNTKGKKGQLSENLTSPPKRGLTRQLTKHVVTRWYRAPELILVQPYTSAVDIWSLGCILAELLSMQEGNYQDRRPLFPGGSCYPLSGKEEKTDRLDQLRVILDIIGTPKDVDSMASAEYIKQLPPFKGKPFESLYPSADPQALDLLKRMLQFRPEERCTAEQALDHSFLKSVRRHELEKSGSVLEAPEFLNAPTVDLALVKKHTYEEVLWYRHQMASHEKKASAE